MRAISITMDSMFPLKVLTINKSKDTKTPRSSLVCRICNILFLEFLTDSLNLPVLSPADLVDMMSNSLHMEIMYCRWFLFPRMIPLETFIHQPCLAYWMINSALFCSIWLTDSMTYLFKEVQAKKIMLSNYLWIGPKTIDTIDHW